MMDSFKLYHWHSYHWLYRISFRDHSSVVHIRYPVLWLGCVMAWQKVAFNALGASKIHPHDNRSLLRFAQSPFHCDDDFFDCRNRPTTPWLFCPTEPLRVFWDYRLYIVGVEAQGPSWNGTVETDYVSIAAFWIAILRDTYRWRVPHRCTDYSKGGRSIRKWRAEGYWVRRYPRSGRVPGVGLRVA